MEERGEWRGVCVREREMRLRVSNTSQFSVVQELISHTASVTCVAGVYLLLGDREEGETPSIRTLIASGASDSTLKVWERVGINGGSI